MPSFEYRARDKKGALVTGILEAEKASDLETSLDRMGLIPIKVTSIKKWALPAVPDFIQLNRISQQDVILFSRQLATLFGAGIPITRALFTLERQFSNPRFVEVIKMLREDIEAGNTFSAALKKRPDSFPELYSNMIEAGEAGGFLDSVLERLAFMLEKNAENRSKVKSATLYPKLVLGAIAIAVVILMNFVIPRFAKLYASFQVELPLPTRMLIYISYSFTRYWYMGIVLTAAAFFLLRAYVSTEGGRLEWDKIKLKVPVFGPLLKKSALSRFSRVLGSLYKSGLPILQSLDIASRAVENRFIAEYIKKIESEVRAGKGLSVPMSASGVFPPMLTQMVTVGEDTGNLDEMLEKAAEYYDQEVDATIRNLTTVLEPILLSFIFVMVLFLALAIFLPMWDILKLVRR